MGKRKAAQPLLSHDQKKPKLAHVFSCDVCNVSFNSDTQWKGHLKGKKHRNKEKAKQTGKQNDRATSPSSDPEDYNTFRKRAPRIKKKNRVRVRKQAVEYSDDQMEETPKIVAPSATKRQPCPFLTRYCLLRHPCTIEQGTTNLNCRKCKQDLRKCKLNVSITNSKIRFISALPKEKFQAHEQKCTCILQAFALLADLRLAISVLRAPAWAISIFKVITDFLYVYVLNLIPRTGSKQNVRTN